MEEKRRADRVNIYQMIQLFYGKENIISSEAVDIGKFGMKCKVSEEMVHHSRFFMMFDIPIKNEQYQIKCEGVLVHSTKVDDGYEIGVSFADILPEDQEKLEEFIQDLDQ